nr:MAG TPA: hypothetical protein [Caudoviricetes sp.]
MFLREIFEIDNGGGVFCAEKIGWVGEEKRLFYFGDFSRYSPGGAGRRLYTPPVETPAPAHPNRLHRSALDTRPPTRADRDGSGAGLPAQCVR